MGWVRRWALVAFLALGCGVRPSAIQTTVPDSDGDGLSDANDACPNAAEEHNGVDDDDGCPDMAVHSGSCEAPFAIVYSITFATASDVPEGGQHPVIDAVARTVVGNPGVGRLEVRGHVLTDERRLGLGVRRARAVAATLTELGVARDRLVVVDLADRCPTNDASGSGPRVDFRFLELDGEPVAHPDECSVGTGPPADPCIVL